MAKKTYLIVALGNAIKSSTHIRPRINENNSSNTLNELLENSIVKEGGSIKGLMFSEEFMALVILIDCYFWNEIGT